MRILHLSDLHICSTPETILFGVNPYKNLLLALEIIRTVPDIDLCVVSGDISDDGSRESYLIADDLLAHLNCPVYIINGNHDNYSNLINRRYRKMCYVPLLLGDGVSLLFLNSVCVMEDGSNRSSGIIAPKEMTRLREFLEMSGDKIVIMHHPVIKTGGWMDRRMLMDSEEFLKLTTNSVKAVLSGHNHFAHSVRIGDCLFSTAPSVSTTFSLDTAPFEEVYSPAFSIVDISSGEVSSQIISICV